MEHFQVIQPSTLLAPYVKQYWFLKMENAERGSQRLVPSGSMALSFHRGNRTYSSLAGDYLPQSYFYGITTHYTDLALWGQVDFICIVFQVAGAKAFFSMSMSELNNSCVSLDALSDPGLQELEQQLNDITDNRACVRLIEQFLLRRIYQLDEYRSKRINAVINSIHKGETDIQQLAQTACLGYKQFKRIFTDTIGANPKDFLQIMRFQKLHRLLQLHTGVTVEQLAHECNYYDKSHLIKEVKDFCGFTPGELLQTCDAVYSDYHALFRSAFVDMPSR